MFDFSGRPGPVCHPAAIMPWYKEAGGFPHADLSVHCTRVAWRILEGRLLFSS